MAGLFSKILENVEFKGSAESVVLKIVAGFLVVAVVAAFTIGQLKMRHLNKIDDIEASANEGIQKTEQLEIRVEEGFQEQNEKIDKIYKDGMDAFEEYRTFNNEQLKLIIDYSEENKELLKKMLELNSQEKAHQIESDLEQSRRENPEFTIGVTPKVTHATVIEVESGREQHTVKNAPENYLDTLDLSKFTITKKVESEKYKGLYDFEYESK